jgi:hypothetical protein
MTAEEYQQWEALALNRKRYSSDEEYRLNVIRWMRHMEPLCEQILRQLENPFLKSSMNTSGLVSTITLPGRSTFAA